MGFPSVRELHGRTPETARSWALNVVEEIAERQVRGRCWEVRVRNGSSHGKGWAFDSLLGAMWLQMQRLMRGQTRRYEWCGALLEIDLEQQLETATESAPIGGWRKPRSDRRFCDNKGRCKAKWNYHRGPGISSKENRRKERGRRKIDAT